MKLQNILTVCEQFGFLIKKPTQKYVIAPAGTLLLENLKLEWLQAMVNNKDFTIFYAADQSFTDGYNYAKSTCIEKLPFGFATCMESNEQMQKNELSLASHMEKTNYLKTTVFIPPSNSIQMFHQWQRQRRMWWRSFSAAPGRYFTTDIIEQEGGSQEIQVCAKYPWGNELVEVLQLSEKHPLLTEEQQQNFHERKRVRAMILQSSINMSTMYLNTICDAFEVLKGQDSDERRLLKFHRKLAPYKVGYAVSNPSNAQLLADLKDLSRYLCKKLRSNNVTSLLLPNFARDTLDAQFDYFDHLGVPYAIVLNEGTLKNGVLHLRSRDTTIKEQVHVNDLPNYINLLFKNY